MRTIVRTIWLNLALAASAVAVVDGAAWADLASHRAVYAMTLASTRSAGEVTDLSGKMALEFVDVCDGWTVEQRIALLMVNPDGREARSYTSFVSWEAKDGTRFRFEQQTLLDGKTIEEISGHAVLEPAKGGFAYLTKPEKIEIPLPRGTLFPSRHTVQLIARAQAGEGHFLALVFDGSTLENPNQVSAFIGAPATLKGLGDGDGEQTAWPIRVAFFGLKRQTPEPDIEIALMLQADGVAREVDLDYQGFTIHGELASFESLPPMKC